MSEVVTAIPRAGVTPRPIDEWAQIIADDLTRAVEGIIAAPGGTCRKPRRRSTTVSGCRCSSA
jgi:hypothetical protein